jgi:hypothetical protein
MESHKSHTRYREISLCDSDGNGSYQANRSLGIVLFKSDAKLRSHAVKHLTNLNEFEKTWEKIISIDKELIRRSIAKLQDIECPHYSDGEPFPSCHKCQKFNKCTDFISELENHYFNLVLQIIREGGAIPRYVDFFSNDFKKEMFVLMPDRPVVIKAALLKHGTYNLVTCYSSSNQSFTEMRDQQREIVQMEAGKKNLLWCDENTWGIEALSHNGGIDPKPKRKKKKSKQKSKRYYRGGSNNWRQFLDESNN